MIFAQYKRLFWFTLALHINFNLNIWYIQRASRFRAWKNPRENLRDSVNDWRIHYQSCYNGGRVVLMLIFFSRNDYLSPLKIIIRRPRKVTLKPRLNDQTISPNIVLEENFLHSYPTFCITNNFFWSFRHHMSCKANTILPKICG